MNKLIILISAILSGCVANKTNSPIPINQYDKEVLKGNAESLNMEYSDYLNALKNGEISKLRQPVFYQAHDPNWAHDPSINPVFESRMEAEEYAKRNNMEQWQGDQERNTEDLLTIGHSYIVREIDYRYEVRQVNDLANDLLHTTSTFNDAYEYVVEYSSAHSDLIIFDLRTGKTFEETP